MKHVKLFESFLNEYKQVTFIKFKGKKVDMRSIEIEGVDSNDYPDFVDSFAAYAEWTNGKELTDSELDDFNDEFPDYVQELAMETFQ
jgi:hypothetical protein